MALTETTLIRLSPEQRHELNAALAVIQTIFSGSLVGFVIAQGDTLSLALNPGLSDAVALALIADACANAMRKRRRGL